MNPTETVILKRGDVIQLLKSKELFTINKVYEGNIVDMTAVVPKMNSTYKEQFFSIKLVNFNIINKNVTNSQSS